MTTRADRAVKAYLKELEAALSPLPRSRRRQLVNEIAAHIAEARAELVGDAEAGTLNVLQSVGSPADIAEAALAEIPAPPIRSRDGWVPWLLLLGGFLFVVGWVVGVVQLWASPAWILRDKLIGTFVFPLGLLLPLLLLQLPLGASGSVCSGSVGPGSSTVTTCSGGAGMNPAATIALLAVLTVAPIAVAVHLTHQRRVAVTSI